MTQMTHELIIHSVVSTFVLPLYFLAQVQETQEKSKSQIAHDEATS